MRSHHSSLLDVRPNRESEFTRKSTDFGVVVDLIRLNNLIAQLPNIVWAGQHDNPSLWQPLILEMSIRFAN
jgi:hypothetical protein